MVCIAQNLVGFLWNFTLNESLLERTAELNILFYFETGPANWYKDCPIAVDGRRQSPIDLIDPEVKRDSNLKPLKASYPPFPKSKILNNGHTAQFSPDASSNLSGNN